MPKFAAVALYSSLPLRNLVDFSFCASPAGRTLSAAPLTLEDAALICRELRGYYGCGKFAFICRTIESPGKVRWWHEHEHADEHWTRYEREREYAHEDYAKNCFLACMGTPLQTVAP